MHMIRMGIAAQGGAWPSGDVLLWAASGSRCLRLLWHGGEAYVSAGALKAVSLMASRSGQDGYMR